MARIILTILIILLPAACSGENIPLIVTTPVVSPSPPPLVFSPTPPFIPSTTLTTTILPTSATLAETSSFTPTETVTPTSTVTPTGSPDLVLDILGCNTSLDITHGMGEVTNAYPVIRNGTAVDLTNVCATLSATDEARLHPDKTACVALLPIGDQVTLKLTVDTGFRQDTAIQVDVSTTEGYTASVTRSSCRDTGLPGWVPAKVGAIEPIQ